MDVQYTIYWKELTDEICSDIKALLASKTLHPAFHKDLYYFLELADKFNENIDGLFVKPTEVVPLRDKSSRIFRLGTIATHFHTTTLNMLAIPSLYDNQQLVEPEHSQIESVHIKSQRLLSLIANVDNYYKLTEGNPDKPSEYNDMDMQSIIKWASVPEQSRQVSYRTISVNELDNPIYIHVVQFRVRQILYHLCTQWILSAAETAVNITISKHRQAHMAKLVFEYPDLSITDDELNNRLNAEYALQHNMLDLILAKQTVEWQHGKFESNVSDQKVTFTVYLPLSKGADIVY